MLTDWQIDAQLHWFKVRTDQTVRHILLRHGAIKPISLADAIQVEVGKQRGTYPVE